MFYATSIVTRYLLPKGEQCSTRLDISGSDIRSRTYQEVLFVICNERFQIVMAEYSEGKEHKHTHC